jgi:hypothetical protein
MARAKKEPKPKPEPKPPGDYELLVDHYFVTFARIVGLKPLWTPRSGPSFKTMLASMPLAEAMACIDSAWEDDFFRDKIREIHHIAANMNKYRRVLPPERKVAKPVEPSKDLISGVSIDQELKVKLGL